MGAPPEGAPQDDVLAIELPDVGLTLDRFLSYSFNSNFTEATDQWHFVTGGKENPSLQILNALVPGRSVRLKINGSIQASGYIDDVHIHADGHGGGKIITVTGRDTFAPVVGGGADPYHLKFTANQTFDDLLIQVFERFGFTSFVIDDSADRAIRTGLNRQRFSKKKGKPLKRFTFTQQLKPHPGEGSFQYVSRLAIRFGLWVWPSADGKTVIVSTPDYTQAPIYKVMRQIGTNVSNVLGGGIGCHTSHQPSVIVATGFAGGGEWSRSHVKVAMINELVGYESDGVTVSPEVLQTLSANTDAFSISRSAVFPPTLQIAMPHAQALFLHDDEARTQDELVNYVQSEMSKYQKEMWVGQYTVQGHTYKTGAASVGIPWTVNTIADVEDEVCQFGGVPFRAPMWVCGRTFEKDRGGEGTKTHLHLTLPHTLEFFPVQTGN